MKKEPISFEDLLNKDLEDLVLPEQEDEPIIDVIQDELDQQIFKSIEQSRTNKYS